MSKSAVYILNFKDLYNIIHEIKNFFNIELFNFEDTKSIIEYQKKRSDKSFIIVTKKKFNEDCINNKQIITIDSLPLNFFTLIELIGKDLRNNNDTKSNKYPPKRPKNNGILRPMLELLNNFFFACSTNSFIVKSGLST